MNRSKLSNVIDVVNRACQPNGFECIDVEWHADSRTLRIFVDREQGIDLDGCVAVNHLLEDCPEIDALIDGNYILEVSSPGIERPLRTKRHFEAQLGRTVQVRLQRPGSGRVQGTGKLVAVGDDNIKIDTPQGVWEFNIEHVQKANLVFDWSQT